MNTETPINVKCAAEDVHTAYELINQLLEQFSSIGTAEGLEERSNWIKTAGNTACELIDSIRNADRLLREAGL